MHDKARLLLVDDDTVLLKGMKHILESAGYAVTTATSGRECLKHLEENKPDMVLLDVVLPDVTGTEVCKEIKNRPTWGDVYVVLLSSVKISSDDQAMGLEYGADGYIPRPVSNRELLARVKALFRLKQTERRLRQSDENFRRVFEESPIAAATLRLDRGFELVNAEMARITGFTKDQLTGMKYDDLTFPEDSVKAIDCFERLLQGDTSIAKLEARLVSKDGRTLWTKMSVKLMRDECGAPQYFFPIIQDVSAERLYEEERERLLSELRESLAKVRRLSGFIPICSSCKKIRDDEGYWKQVETYVSEHSEAEFSHSICPDCAKKLYPEFYK